MNTDVLTIPDAAEMLKMMSIYMENVVDGFKSCQEAYQNALQILRTELGDEPVNTLTENICKRCEVDILFAGNLGYQANLNNFRDPVARTFLDVDFEEYLRLDVLEQMPQRTQAQTQIDAFHKTLPEELKSVYDAVSMYLIDMELNLTKLSHYHGFLYGNKILPLIEPGYVPNMVLSMKYHSFLKNWYSKF